METTGPVKIFYNNICIIFHRDCCMSLLPVSFNAFVCMKCFLLFARDNAKGL